MEIMLEEAAKPEVVTEGVGEIILVEIPNLEEVMEVVDITLVEAVRQEIMGEAMVEIMWVEVAAQVDTVEIMKVEV